MATFNRTTRLLSRPVPVIWAGFRSTTTELQRCGWQIAVDFDISRHAYQFMFKHEHCALYGLSDQWYMDDAITETHFSGELPPIHLGGFYPRIETYRSTSTVDMLSFHQIDAKPSVVSREIQSTDDLMCFKLIPKSAEEIVVDKANLTVIEHLQAIKELQSEEQREIRERMRGAGRHREGEYINPNPGKGIEVVANLVAVA